MIIMKEKDEEKAPGQILYERYIPLKKVEEVCGITIKQAQNLIDTNKIRYAEFREPGAQFRTPHVDPVEINDYLERKRKRREAYESERAKG